MAAKRLAGEAPRVGTVAHFRRLSGTAVPPRFEAEPFFLRAVQENFDLP